MRKSDPVLLSDQVTEAFAKVGLSLAALIAMLLFFDAGEKYGWPQLLVLLVLHVTALSLLARAFQTRNADLAVGALLLGVAWNLGVVAYLFAITGSQSLTDTTPLNEPFVGAAVLTYWYAASIRKIRKIKAERRRVSQMTREQLEQWRVEQFTKIHDRAVKLAGLMKDKELRNRHIERPDLVRRYEVLVRNELGVGTSQFLLEGMDIRGLDLRMMRGLDQQQIDRAVGDATTQLPDYLDVPQTWKRHE